MRSKPPSGIALSPFHPKFQSDPHGVLDQVRSAAPVLHDVELQRWFITGHDQVRSVLRDKYMSSNPRNAEQGSYARRLIPHDARELSMLFMDDPDHKRLRSLINKAFAPKMVEAMRPRIRQIANALLSEIRSPEFDLMTNFAGPLPIVAIGEMLGIAASDFANFKSWSEATVATVFNPLGSKEQVTAAMKAQTQLDACFRSYIESRRSRLGNDLISAMVATEEDNDRLSDAEIVSQCNLLLVAGNITTTDLIGNGVKALMDNPTELAKLRQKPELLTNAVEEILRYDPPLLTALRIAVRNMEVNGCPIRRGQSVIVSLPAANHDPDIYPEPHKFDVERTDVHHQSFGGGYHFCLGAPLARIEAQEAISTLLSHFPRLNVSPLGYRYRVNPTLRGLTEYWLSSQS
jgi:cytochrome P450